MQFFFIFSACCLLFLSAFTVWDATQTQFFTFVYAVLPLLWLGLLGTYLLFTFKWMWLLVLCLGFTLWHMPFSTIVPNPPTENTLRIFTANVHYTNTHPRVLTEILAYQPHILSIQEINQTMEVQWAERLQQAGYYTALHPLRAKEDILLASQFPISDMKVLVPYQAMQATITLPNNTQQTVVYAHAFTPMQHAGQQKFFYELFKQPNLNDAIFMGDFNTPPYLPNMRTLKHVHSLQDANPTWRHTWPSLNWLPFALPLLTLDYILLPNHHTITNRGMVRLPHADHLALWADVRYE